jgi:AraC family transcriptional regulator
MATIDISLASNSSWRAPLAAVLPKRNEPQPTGTRPENQEDPTPSASIPLFTSQARPYLGGCVSGRSRFRGSLVAVDEYRCLHDGTGLREERWHAGPVLNLCLSGASIAYTGGRQRVVDPTRVSFQPAEVPYRTMHPWGTRCHGLNLVLNPEFADAATGGRSAQLHALVLSTDHQLRLRQLLSRLDRGQDDDALRTEEELVGLVASILTPPESSSSNASAHRADTDDRHQRCVFATCALLNERYREPLDLATIARLAATTPAHLTRVFRSSTGMPVHRYRTRLRLLAALDAVWAGHQDLTALALDLGFASHSHLTSLFRREFGAPPATLRRQLAARRQAVLPRRARGQRPRLLERSLAVPLPA